MGSLLSKVDPLTGMLIGGDDGGRRPTVSKKQQQEIDTTTNPVDLYSTFLRDVPSIFTKDRQLFVPNSDYVRSGNAGSVTPSLVPTNISMADRIARLRQGSASPSIASQSGMI